MVHWPCLIAYSVTQCTAIGHFASQSQVVNRVGKDNQTGSQPQHVDAAQRLIIADFLQLDQIFITIFYRKCF